MNFLRNSYTALIGFVCFVNVSVAEEPVQIPCEQTVFLKQAQYQTAVDIFYKYVGTRRIPRAIDKSSMASDLARFGECFEWKKSEWITNFIPMHGIFMQYGINLTEQYVVFYVINNDHNKIFNTISPSPKLLREFIEAFDPESASFWSSK